MPSPAAAEARATRPADSASGSTQEPIKIGAILSLTGTYAGLGEPEKNLIEMEVKKINDAGGINGRPVEVIIEDDATDEAQAVAAASRLIEQENVVAIIGATGTGQTMAMRGDIQRAGIPQVSMAGGTVITNPVDPLVFATPWSNTIVVPFTLDYLKSQGITKIGLITDSGGFGKDGQAVFAAAAPKAGVEIVADETLNPGDTDMTAQLTKIKNSDAEAIVMWTAGSEAAIIAKNAKDLGIDLPIYGSHGIARQEFIDGAGEAAEGVKLAAGKVLDPSLYGEDSEAATVANAFISRLRAGLRREAGHVPGLRLRRPVPGGRGRQARGGRSHAGGSARADPGHDRLGRHRRHLQHDRRGPQRPQRGRPADVRDQRRQVHAGAVTRTVTDRPRV